MIPLQNRDILIERILAGDSIQEACEASHISVPSLYRFFKEDPIFKAKYDSALFEAKERVRSESQTQSMSDLKKMVLKRKG